MPTVLIVEDNERNLRLARDVLAYGGFNTEEATTAEVGIELAAAHLPDVILMDVQLPGMDGMEALAALRADARTRAIPVIAVTAFAMGGDRERMLETGFDGYVSKPVDIDVLLATVGDLCNRGEAGA